MATGMFGARPEELRELGGRFGDVGAAQRSTAEALAREVEAVDWVGADRDRYVADWAAGPDAGLRALADALERIGLDELPRQAREQEEASAASGRAGGPGGCDSDVAKSEDEQNADDTRVDDASKHTPHDGEVPNDADDIDTYDVNQRGIGDCWALAAVASLARTEAGRRLLAENITFDPQTNQYVVTLYENGRPVEVRVDNSFIDGANGSPQGEVGDDGKPNFAAIYEKALAEHYGEDYGDIWGGDPARAMEVITGKSADQVKTDPFLPWSETADSDNIRERLADGQAVTLSTRPEQPEGSPIVDRHAYVVTEVLPNGDVVVYNPWGNAEASDPPDLPSRPGGTGEKGELIVPADKIDDYFRGMDAVKP